ncbi:MAG: transcription-repair coupling factor [Acidobacteria bacterium RIFCSPLOWO2_12_FULL_68_19]|nr:MAG: transcription-repair coupling factor [Acidobacteria bacterium RIFCSPLOWO2_12_FULL_68_19]
MATTASLTLRALFSQAAARAALEEPAPITAGLSPSAKALAAVAAARAASTVTVLVAPTDKDVDQLTGDARFFYAALEGASDLAAEQAVLPFPSLQVDPYRGMTPHFRVAAARARALHAAATEAVRLVVASAAALLPRVSPPERLLRAALAIRVGTEIEPQALADLLTDGGFTLEDPVDEHGAFTIRGGIVDIFPAAAAEPVRIEFVGDMVESLRRFNPSSQRSTAAIDQVLVVPLRERFDDEPATVSVIDVLAAARGVRLLVSEYEQVDDQARKVRGQLESSYGDAAARGHVAAAPPDEAFLTWEEVESRLRGAPRLEELAVEEGAHHVSCQPAREFRGRVPDWIADVRDARRRGDTVLVVADSHGRAERTVEILQEYEIVAVPVERAEDAHAASTFVAVGSLSRGFRLADAALQLYAETDVFEEERRAAERRSGVARAFLSDLRDLKAGDLVVHVDHGIGEFVGLRQLGVRGTSDAPQEFLELRYAGDDKLFVPVERLDLVQKYTGGARPALDRLGGTSWERAKSRVKKAMRDMAEELLKLYAQRKAVPGHAFAADTHWQEEFEDAFPYELTPDQTAAIADIKKDMEGPTPMDRLLCGDVGYGKTEVAMRAAFKAMMDGKQVAFLAPTTVLAFQHLKTLRDRFAGFPVTVDMVSRFRTRQEITRVLSELASGRVDIIVGTHRLLSKDVTFKDLGLLIVDEEQRFGVAHKERIKQLRKKVDVLTMTATPIPRTLNMSLVGIRDMSIIETPPKDRLSIQTNVVKFDASVIERAIRNEMARGGQVYFVHNRVESISAIGNLLQRLVPEAKVVVGHGQMSEEELERAMLGFVDRKYDVLLATTIVENGLDIPNANTIIVNRADRHGLSQLYQLRGRVGRSDRPAFAYLLVPPQESLAPVARKRLAAIKEFSDLGSGFRVAALDLEIRGAGNLLGGEQSGHIEAVGFEMYMKLLEEAVRELKGEEIDEEVRATVNLRVDLKIDADYIPDMNQRLTVYRRVAASRTGAEIEGILEEVRDRYGPPPDSLLNLAEYGRIRIAADRLGIETIDREDRLVVIKFRPMAKVDPVRLIRVVQEHPGAMLAPPASLKLDLEADDGGRRPSGVRREGADTSWWTARATAGVVAAGFTKDEILRKPQRDPRGEGGMFPRLESLLERLS